MKKHYVSLETAKLLKEKGYNELCDNCYNKNEELITAHNIRNNSFKEPKIIDCTAPEIHEAQQWLREEHNIHIEIGLENFTDGYIWQYQLLKIGSDVSELSGDGEYKSYEQALEEGIINALKMI